MGIVRFDFDSDGPSHIQAWIPTVNQGGVAAPWQPSSEEGTLEACVERNETQRSSLLSSLASPPPLSLHRLLSLQNKKPKWDESHGGHVLNFQVSFTGEPLAELR
jgi:hypothetical protein